MSSAWLLQSLPHVKRTAQIELIGLVFIEFPLYILVFIIQWPKSQTAVRGRIMEECDLPPSALSWHVLGEVDEADRAT